MLQDSLLAQQSLDEIHECALTLREFSLNIENSASRKRLAVILLKQLGVHSNRLFEQGGRNAAEILEEVHDINSIICKFDKKALISDSEKVLKEVIYADYFSESMIDKFKALSSIVSQVRQIEQTFAFQHELWTEKRNLSVTMDCSMDQLTYGSSTFELWQRLLQSEFVLQAVQQSVTESPEVIVLGSSLGLLLFYSSTLLPASTRCVGFEVMSALHRVASDLIRTHIETFGNITAVLGDMFDADLSRASVSC